MRKVREGQRDVTTTLAVSVGTLFGSLFNFADSETGCLIVILTIAAHRWAPDLAAKRRR
jgi:hypothetical protein